MWTCTTLQECVLHLGCIMLLKLSSNITGKLWSTQKYTLHCSMHSAVWTFLYKADNNIVFRCVYNDISSSPLLFGIAWDRTLLTPGQCHHHTVSPSLLYKYTLKIYFIHPIAWNWALFKMEFFYCLQILVQFALLFNYSFNLQCDLISLRLK